MPDELQKIGHSIIQHGNENKRVYLIKLDKRDLNEIVHEIENLAKKKHYGKIFCKVPEWARDRFENHHYRLKASIPRFYQGKENVYFMTKFLNPKRRLLTTKDKNKIQTNLKLARVKAAKRPPKSSLRYQIRKLRERHVETLSHLYEKVYDSYPFPITEAAYLRQTMQSHIDYFGIFIDKSLIAASSAEKDIEASNAEMTDFATLPHFRGKGLATALLVDMENEMKNQKIRTLFTIARALSPGMNITFARCGYKYSGTLINNTQIFGHIESMNVWYKHIDYPAK
jgi:putative beta-lysine N-acetyltransferase